MMKLTCCVFVAVSVLMLGGVASAADMKDMNMSKPTMDQAQGVGVIKAVDPHAGTVTIAHEPIKSFEWPSMTMKFKVADPALLKGIAVGNKVNFTLLGKDMNSTVTALKIAN